MEETAHSPKKANGSNAILGRACGVLAMLCVFIPAVFWGGGVLENETTRFIVNYSDSRSVLQKVFNPFLNDWNMYQGRELSYLFDYLDARFLLFLVKHFDVSIFIPLSAVVSSIFIILIFRRGVRQILPGLDRVTAELLLLPFLTCFVFVSTMGLFYRSAKPLLAPVLLAIMFYILRIAQSRPQGSAFEQGRAIVNRQSLFSFALLVVAALLDRQGFFYVLIACVVLLVHYLMTRRLKDLLIAAAAAAIFGHLYNVVLGPAIIWAVNGQQVDFGFQRIPAEELAKLPVHCLKAGRLLFANAAGMVGGYYVVGYLVLSLVAAWFGWRAILFYKGWMPEKRREQFKSGQSLGIIYALMVLAAQIVMFGLMIARHPYIYDWMDHRYWYYPLPFLMTVLLGLALLLNALIPRLRIGQRQVLRVALVLIAVSNLLHLPAYRNLMVGAPWFGPVYARAEKLKVSIRNRSADPELGEEYNRFFLLHERRRNR
ncbi:MAG TPA: hypothetical protein VEX43_00010 [Chthoniobacterales bacterium]|nr:hypothetical protein [Chthoniobacterales bacterium]